MNNKTPIFLGSILGATGEALFQSVVSVIVMAAVGALVGWIVKEVCNAIKNKWLNRKTKNNVPG